jgi:hypothetical protein
VDFGDVSRDSVELVLLGEERREAESFMIYIWEPGYMGMPLLFTEVPEQIGGGSEFSLVFSSLS